MQIFANTLLSLSRAGYGAKVSTFTARNSSKSGASLYRYLSSQSVAQSDGSRLFPEDVNIIYDSKCNVCKLEMNFLAKRDAEKINVGAPKLKLTDVESDGYDPKDPSNGGVTYESGMKAIHAVTSDGKVIKGVPVFQMAYEKVNLGWLFQITTWPVVKQLVDVGYKFFAKYRTYLTRGASVETLVRQYEEKKALELKMKEEDCDECNKTRQS
jgi:predicted DCC family thiol-disulfide oxidoreductase YuxK